MKFRTLLIMRIFYRCFVFVVFIIPMVATGQNLQLHYDFGKADNGDSRADRNYFTATMELFKPDSLGSTFLFIDVDFDKENDGASMSYFEISRKFTLHKSGLGIHVEYDDGTPDYINRAWLVGVCYPINIKGFVLSTSVLYRAAKYANHPDVKFTTVWFQPLLHGRVLFSGFIDLWSQDDFSGVGKDLVILSEPQLWFVCNNHFSVGTEVEISRNFFTFDNEFEFMPTAAIKWDF